MWCLLNLNFIKIYYILRQNIEGNNTKAAFSFNKIKQKLHTMALEQQSVINISQLTFQTFYFIYNIVYIDVFTINSELFEQYY